MGLLWVVLSFLELRGTVRPPPDVFGVMNMVQVSVGLLLMSVGAATSLAEERVRGSLDVLLCTPLSTGTILAGKWWGAFRVVPHIAVWPALTAGLLLWDGGRWISYVLLLGLILAYGAVITSLGLALATWVSRLGRAVALCVSAYLALTIGWAVLIVMIFDPAPIGVYLSLASPLFGTIFGTISVTQIPFNGAAGAHAEEIASSMFVWIVVESGIAAALFAATVRTFDGCLGRAGEDADNPPPLRDQESSLALGEMLDVEGSLQ
jgi:ABC-type Na+ efflux pump permease subunit